MKKWIENILQKDVSLSGKLRQWGEKRKHIHTLAVFFAHSGDSWYWLAFLFTIWLFTGGQWHTYTAFLAGSILIQAIFVLAIKFKIGRAHV